MAWRGRRYSGRGFGAAGRGGNGYWARATGMPGWMRSAYGYPAYGGFSGYGRPAYGGRGRGNPYPYCRFFPWLPRRWWSGMYGPVQWTSQGPMLGSQTQTTPTGQYPSTPPMNFPPMTPYGSPTQSMTPTAPTDATALRQQKQMLEQQLESLEQQLKELEESK